jgi:HD-GYP domain-containing protein (c-di-GMP phosphodiesterase class II)
VTFDDLYAPDDFNPAMKKIPAQALKPGMFLVEYGEGTFVRPYVRPRKLLTEPEEVEDIRAAGVKWVYIDTAHGLDVSDEEAAEAEPEMMPTPGVDAVYLSQSNKIAYHEEIYFARKIYNRTLEYVRTVMEDLRHGRPFDFQASEPLVRDIMDSVLRNDTAASSLTILRRKSQYLYTHCVNVSVLAAIFGRRLGLLEEKLKVLATAGLFLDIGKIRLSDKILNKPGKLTPEEFEHVKWHPAEGYILLRDQKGVSDHVLEAVLDHHERYDGQGYPRCLNDRNLSTYTRILAIADAYDAMTSDKPYKTAMLPTEAMKNLYAQRGRTYHPEYIELFIRSLGIFPVGSFVRLSDGRFAVVSDVASDMPLCPQVKVVYDHKMRPMRSQFIDLASPQALADDLLITECVDPKDYRIDLGLLLD